MEVKFTKSFTYILKIFILITLFCIYVYVEFTVNSSILLSKMFAKHNNIFAVLNTVYYMFRILGLGPYQKISCRNKQFYFKSTDNHFKYFVYIISEYSSFLKLDTKLRRSE